MPAKTFSVHLTSALEPKSLVPDTTVADNTVAAKHAGHDKQADPESAALVLTESGLTGQAESTQPVGLAESAA
ncbi:MAG: hypothetical protein RR547_07105 [Raoultibacter sp.]